MDKPDAYDNQLINVGVCLTRKDKERLRVAAFEARESISEYARKSILARIDLEATKTENPDDQ